MAKKQTDPKAPKRPGRIKQMYQAYQQTQREDPTTLPWMIGALVASIALFTLLMWLIFKAPLYGAFIGLLIGVLAAMFILGRRAERAAYAKIEGQPGAALAAMQSIRRGWNVEREPAAMDPRSQAMLFRASGRSGIALVTENTGGPGRKLMQKESQRLERLFPGVPIHQILVGRGEGQTPLPKLAADMQRMKRTLTRDEAGEVTRLLLAMPNPIRQAIPKGMDPMRARPNRKAMRGR